MNQRDRRALQVGGAIVLAAVLCSSIIPRSVDIWQRTSTRLEQNRLLLAETQSAIAELPRMEDSMKQLTSRVARMGAGLLAGNTPEAAMGDLTARITSLAGWYHAAIVSHNRIADSSEAGLLQRVHTTAVLQGDFRSLAGLVRSLARDSVVTVIEEMKITALEPQAPAASPEKLQAEVQLTAWFLARSSGS